MLTQKSYMHGCSSVEAQWLAEMAPRFYRGVAGAVKEEPVEKLPAEVGETRKVAMQEGARGRGGYGAGGGGHGVLSRMRGATAGR